MVRMKQEGLNIMTTQTETPARRKFRAIFTVAITPASVQTRTASNGKRFATMKGASVVFPNGETAERTVMAFGEQLDAVASKLRKGRKVELAVQRDGGTLRVIGLPRPKAAAAA